MNNILFTCNINDISDTKELSEIMADYLQIGDVILLEGDLGSGKTEFTRHLVKKLLGVENVTSPTFGILNVYDGEEFNAYHYDLYRIEDQYELYEIGMEDALKLGVTIVEWPRFLDNFGIKNKIKIEFISSPAICVEEQNEKRTALITIYGRFINNSQFLRVLKSNAAKK